MLECGHLLQPTAGVTVGAFNLSSPQKTMSGMVPQLLIWSAATQAFAVGSSCSWPRSAKDRLRDLSGDSEAAGNDLSQTLDERPSTLYMSGASRPTRVHRVDAIASLW
ncbi:hypothetical protein CLAIMM_09166 [Cladophialophora immunda]|nr:hypothetical protein CLAIMM_09166 [Cladophialophora immunda]